MTSDPISIGLKSESLSSLAALSDSDQEDSAELAAANVESSHSVASSRKSKASGHVEINEVPKVIEPARQPSKSSLRSQENRSKTDAELHKQIDDLKRQLEDSRAEVRKLSESIDDERDKAAREKMEASARYAEELEKTRADSDRRMRELREDHERAVSRIEREAEEKAARKGKIDMDEQRIMFEREISELKQAHLDEMQRILSSTDSARRLADLAVQMEGSSKMMSELQGRLEADHARALDHREASVTERERQSKELQDQLLREKQEMDADRVKTQEMLERMEAVLRETKRKQEQEIEAIYRDRARLAAQNSEIQQERDATLARLEEERNDFAVAKEAWEIERKRIQTQVTEERRQLGKERAEVASLERINKQLQEELLLAKTRQDDQMQMERLVLERDMRGLHARLADLHREEASMRAERMRLDALQAQLDVEKGVIESAKGAMERNIRQAALLHGEAARERHRLQAMQAEVDVAKQQIETGKMEAARAGRDAAAADAEREAAPS
ncbi:establishment of epithelial cell polarity [Polyrhizophydium stewartii]|uniref:Establishment of epithelial cell polarity n=1 Tax=Polyrhizophydium stewartii TaxID=2732419 RepID=A0ABR4N037_9FUNG